MNAVIFSGSFLTFLTALFTLFSVLVGVFMSFRNARRIQTMTVAMDGNLAKLLAAVEEAALARGAVGERDRRDAMDAAHGAAGRENDG
jgi:hypothetical protein